MGGNLAWTLRLSDGTEYQMDTWTNALPQTILNPAFLDEAPEGVEAAVAPWLAMKADWEANRKSENFDQPMTPFYAPYPFGIRPSEYGLIVTCFRTKTLLSLQGYTDLTRIMDMRLMSGPDCDQAFPGRRAQAEALRAAGRILRYEFVLMKEGAAKAFEAAGHKVEAHPHGGAWIATVDGECDYDALTRLCDDLRKKDRFPECNILEAIARVDLSPFTFREFPENSAGMRDLRSAVQDLGFDIAPEHEKDWDDRIAEMAEWEDEDA